MCAERVPLDCHRTLLVCRHLRDAIPGGIHHILADGSLESHTDLERRLVASLRTKQQQRDRSDAQPDLFNAETESPLDRAYRLRGHAIVYKGKSPPSLAGEGIVLVALPRRGGGNLERHTCVGEAP